jgi:hypothetical protein
LTGSKRYEAKKINQRAVEVNENRVNMNKNGWDVNDQAGKNMHPHSSNHAGAKIGGILHHAYSRLLSREGQQSAWMQKNTVLLRPLTYFNNEICWVGNLR